MEAAQDFIMPELATKDDVLAIRSDFLAIEQRLLASMAASFEILTLRLTIRFGVMWAVAIWFLVIILKRC